MVDLSNWDFALHFKAKEVAELIVGIPPEANTNLFGVMGEEAAYVARITPILRRMERAYLSAGHTLHTAATWSDSAKEGLESYPMSPEDFHSEVMEKVREFGSDFALSIFKGELGAFQEQYFSRQEVVRWLKVVDLPSVYRFDKVVSDSKVGESIEFESSFEDRFNSPHNDASEEFRQWLIMDTWSYEAAMFLLAGVIPVEIYEGMGFYTTDLKLLHNDNGEKDERIFRISVLKRLWLSNPENPERAAPSTFLQWADKKNIQVPWLESVQRFGFLLPAAEGGSEPEKPITNKERNNYLNIIGALVELIKTPRSGRVNDTAVINELVQNYGDKPGLGERHLQGVFPKARKSLLG